MNKFTALILSVLVTLLFLINFYYLKESYFVDLKELVNISRVIDGDTLELEDGRTIRLLNINSPEKGIKGSNLAKDYLTSFENESIKIEILETDKYSRSLARIYDSKDNYLNLEIVKLGLASKFLVNKEELKNFLNAEKYAIKNSLGIWNKSVYFECFYINIQEQNEKVIIKNNCLEINFNAWTLKDESRKIYTFKDIKFTIVVINSGEGNDNKTDLYWDSKENIWNNDRDSLYLFDKEGAIAGYEVYGY